MPKIKDTVDPQETPADVTNAVFEVLDAEVKGGKVTAYSRTEAALTELREKFEGRVFEVATTAGDKEAREARKTLVKLRTALDAKREELKRPALDYSAMVQGEFNRIEKEIKALEKPIDEQIKAQEKIEADKKAAELARRDGIKAKIANIAGLANASRDDSLEDLLALQADLDGMEVTEELFGEFVDEAEAAVVAALTEVVSLIEKAKAAQAQSAAVAAAEAAARAAEEERDRLAQELADLKAALAAKDTPMVTEEAKLESAVPEDGTHYSKTTFKENGDPILLNGDGTRSIFCDVDEGGPETTGDVEPETPAETASAADAQAAPWAAGVLSHDISLHTGRQFQLLAKKAELAGFVAFGGELAIIGQRLINGDYKDRLESVDAQAFYSLDFEMTNAARDSMDALDVHL